MSKYPPLFKRIHVTDSKPIADLQQEFEDFWKRISRLVGKSPEKTQGMRKLQEGCMWLTRAIAMSQFESTEDYNSYKPYTLEHREPREFNPGVNRGNDVQVLYKSKKSPE